MFPHILIIIDYDVQVILSLAIIKVGLPVRLCVPSARSGFVVTSVPSGCELSQTCMDSAPGPVSKEPWFPWWLEGEKSLVDRKGPKSLHSQSLTCVGRQMLQGAPLCSTVWPLAGPAGKDRGEEPRKTKPSCLPILPAEVGAKS